VVVERGWRKLERFGPFFAVTVVEDDVLATATATGRGGWRPLTALVTEPDLLTDRIATVRRTLAGPAADPAATQVPAQVAVSVTQFGLTARLVAVALAAAVQRLVLPDATALVFRDRLGGPFPLGVAAGSGGESPGRRRWPESMLQWVRPVTQATIAEHGLSSRVAWGNVASALAGAARMLVADSHPGGSRAESLVVPVLAVEALVGEAFAAPELSGTGGFDAGGGFRRHSCCLIYRVTTDPVLCGDCILAVPPDRRPTMR
jgi:hypothetical protein